MEEGQPDYIEQNVNSILKRNDVATRVHGKDCLPMAGEYTCERMEEGLRKFLGQWAPGAVTKPSPLARSWRVQEPMAQTGRNWNGSCRNGPRGCAPAARSALSSRPSTSSRRNSASCR